MQNNAEYRPRLTSKQAAAKLNLADNTLAKSRCSGELCGVEAPPHTKIGGRVWYEDEDLNAWEAQFQKRKTTRQAA